MNKNTIRDLALNGQRVITRVDFNVPMANGAITDNTRIISALPSIQYILANGASLILMSHLGRPKGEFNPKYSLKPCAEELSKLLGKEVKMAKNCVGEEVEAMAKALLIGEVLLLENVRFHLEENTNDAHARKVFAKKLAGLADIYVNDAFGTAHREHASTANVAEFLPSAVGFLIEKEIGFLHSAIESPKRPLVAILGGAKISDKIPIVNRLLQKADKIIIGGGMAYTFYKAMGFEVGKSLVDNDLVDTCRDFLARGKDKIVLPEDCIGSTEFDFDLMRVISPLKPYDKDSIPQEVEGLDIGPKSVEKFKNVIESAQTLLWNGPMGVFECDDTAKGTMTIAKLLAEATQRGATTVIGGGDSSAAIKKANLTDKMTHISTGGGASLEFLEGKILPGIAVIEDK